MEPALHSTRQNVLLFLGITFALSSIFYALIIHTGKLGAGFGMYVTGLMWCPGLAALITSKLIHRKIADLGWQWGSPRYQVWSYLVPLLYSLIAYLLIWSMGWGGFYNPKFVSEVTASFGWEGLPTGLTIVLSFVLVGIFGMAGSVATALGEEIGWRGFLVPELAKTTSFTKTSLIVGIVWALWHYPILIFADYNSGTPVWYGLACFTTMVVSISFVFTWFRLKSNSLWTGALLHASHNLFIQSYFSPLTADTGRTNYFSGEFGLAVPIVCIFFAFYFWRRRSEVMNKELRPATPVQADTLTASLSSQ